MILLTGGCGYIGSHTCVALLAAGYEVVVLDNLSNSRRVVLDRIEVIAGKRPAFIECDVRDIAGLRQAFLGFPVKAVVHFAGLKSVSDSVSSPLEYYDHNLVGSLRLLSEMQRAGIKRLVFSSSATVYGPPEQLPIAEDHTLRPTNPYGTTKLAVEQLLLEHHRANPDWGIGILRYFNPAGAHSSGLLGEDPLGTPSNLIPYVGQVAIGLREKVLVWGNDYSTSDGTGVRDYIHVMDLAEGHARALTHLETRGCFTVNLGTGKGTSVLEILDAYSRASGQVVLRQICDRRPGDVGTSYADPSAANTLLGWKAERSITEMCVDHWNWQRLNPRGYKTSL